MYFRVQTEKETVILQNIISCFVLVKMDNWLKNQTTVISSLCECKCEGGRNNAQLVWVCATVQRTKYPKSLRC